MDTKFGKVLSINSFEVALKTTFENLGLAVAFKSGNDATPFLCSLELIPPVEEMSLL
jgi:hypothetical protein